MDKTELLELMRADPEIRWAIVDVMLASLTHTVTPPAELADADRQGAPPDD